MANQVYGNVRIRAFPYNNDKVVKAMLPLSYNNVLQKYNILTRSENIKSSLCLLKCHCSPPLRAFVLLVIANCQE